MAVENGGDPLLFFRAKLACVAAGSARVTQRREATRAVPPGWLQSRILSRIMRVAGRHARLAGELLARKRLVSREQ